MGMLDEKKIMAIEMLIDGKANKSQIADRCRVSRTTLYNWLNDDKEFIAELNNRLQGLKTFAEKKLEGKLDYIIDEIYDIAKSDSSEGNQMAKLKALTYLADRVLGKTVSKHELTTTIDDKFKVNGNEIKNVFDELEEGTGEE